jgi:hypothetical protein
LTLATAACGDDGETDSGDGGAGSDIGVDAGADAPADGGSDTIADSQRDVTDAVVDGDVDTSDMGSITTSLDGAGGTARGPGGVELSVPAGALSESVVITIEIVSAIDVTIPLGVDLLSPVYRATPAGLIFSEAIEVEIPWEGSPDAIIYWEVADGGDFTSSDRCLETRDSFLCGKTDHFSLFYVGGQRRAGVCASCGGTECTAAHGVQDTACAFPIDEVGGTSNGVCLHVVNGAGADCGSYCVPMTSCFAVEQCGNQVDDDCNGTVDDLCGIACTDDSLCAVGEICENGYCASCSTMTVACSAGHGTTDAACAFSVGEGGGTANGVCLQRVDGGGACGSVCEPSTTCPGSEICGNHIDDDCNNTVDDLCGTACSVDAHCMVGEICESGFCQSCTSFATECIAANGTTDVACAFTTETVTTNGICYQRVDASGGACGSICDSTTVCRPTEQCGNHIDDDCNGTVDDGCTSCAFPSDCAATEVCRF